MVGEDAKNAAWRETVDSSLRFADTFPQHEHAAVVLGAAAEDLYEMKDYPLARSSAQKLIERFPNADPSVVREAGSWSRTRRSISPTIRRPSSPTRACSTRRRRTTKRARAHRNLAASIYKQGEQANDAGDYRAAADHFLRIKQLAPTSTIRAGAEYDAGAALIRLQDWNGAAQVLDDFRLAHPDHELEKEATKQIAFVYREAGELSQAAAEYERVARRIGDPALRAEALLLAGDLYEQANRSDSALDAYGRYVEQFPKPVETAVETRFKIAAILKTTGDNARYREQLEKIVQIDAAAGGERTDRTRNLAARAALTLAEPTYTEFAAIELRQPFERSLQEKQRDMDAAIDVRRSRGLRSRRRHRGCHLLHGGDLLELQPLADRVGAAGRADGREAHGLRDALEDEAFPFEEQAIEVHEKNLELMRDGVYNAWTEKSLARLAELMPGRYAKSEISSGFLDSIDQYTYHVPERPVLTVDSGVVQPSGESAAGSQPAQGVDATNEHADEPNADASSASAEPTELETEQYPGVANANTQ